MEVCVFWDGLGEEPQWAQPVSQRTNVTTYVVEWEYYAHRKWQERTPSYAQV